MEEIWKPIPGYECLYLASNYGRIRSIKRNTTSGKVLKQKMDKNGYCIVSMYKEGKMKSKKVHRLVWEAFNGPIPDGMQINHKDENASNNNLDNLMLCTQKENNNWGTRTKRASEKNKKPVAKCTTDGEILLVYNSAVEAVVCEKDLMITIQDISNCCKGRQNTARGYKWAYAE